MTHLSRHRGHDIHLDEGRWVYSDDGTPVAEDPARACGWCRLPNREDGHDACIGELGPGRVMNACCGHGNEAEAYVQFWGGGRLGGAEAVRWIEGER